MSTKPHDKNEPFDYGKTKPDGQHENYPVDDGKGKFVRPIRRAYVHTKCGVETVMSQDIAETYARNPKYYGATFCCGCKKHFPVEEFTWSENPDQKVGS